MTDPALPKAPPKGASPDTIAAAVEAIIAELTLQEKVAMMSGHGFMKAFREGGNVWCATPYAAGGGCERLGLEPLWFTDGPRGVCAGQSTCFPVSMARGASFDPDLERRIGEAMGIEIRAQGRTLTGAVCVNLLRHPAWGRAQETYGEDPFHVGEMGAALAVGLQTHNVVASVKHFALNSMENARFKVDVRVDERTLREVYLPHFKRVIDAGCASVMSSYNKINGEYAGQNRYLLTDILRGEWGFDGFVHSDWVFGVRKVYGAAAGLDVENPDPIVFGKHLVKAVEEGAVEPQVIDQACRRILSTQFRFACAEDPLADYTPEMVAAPAHRALALEAAEKSAVLLKNDGMLPLKREAVKRLAVLGRLAALHNTGDNGSSRVRPPYVITALEGLRAYLGVDAVISGDEADLDDAKAKAAAADAVIVVAGTTAEDEGEFIPGDIALEGMDVPDAAKQGQSSVTPVARGGDRTSLRLPKDQTALIEAARASGKPVLVVLVTGSALLIDEWDAGVSAVLQTFYSGMEGGTALVRLVFGEVSPSGKLPFSVPKTEADLPFFDKDADRIEYGPLHGYTLLDAEGKTPAYPFGFGLSYTRFAYRALSVRRAGAVIEASVAVRNAGDVEGHEVVQLYASPPGRAARRPARLLRAFQRISLDPGETRIVRLSVPIDSLRWWEPSVREWRLESGAHTFAVGGSSNPEALISKPIYL